jgi:hypothetical protein
MAADTRADPAFCFMMVVWGERYRHYFTEYCLPSLLAPNNIPCLVNKKTSKFAIATTAEDWTELNKLQVFKLLGSHVEPVLHELPSFKANDPKMLVMSSGHKKLSNYAFERRAFGVNINPDSIYSDHTVSQLQKSAQNGVKMVLYPGVRFEFESVIEELRQVGAFKKGNVISISPRNAAGIGIRNPHPFTMVCNWDSDCFFDFPVYHYLTSPQRDVMVLHTISMGPIMLDYGSINEHDDHIFEKWTLDGDYAHSNFGHFDVYKEIEYVDDSDCFMVLGFTPACEDVPPQRRLFPLLKEMNKGIRLRRVYTEPIVDPLKKRLYLHQVVFHEDDLGAGWEQLAAKDWRIMSRYILHLIADDSVLAYFKRFVPANALEPVDDWSKIHVYLFRAYVPVYVLLRIAMRGSRLIKYVCVGVARWFWLNRNQLGPALADRIRRMLSTAAAPPSRP